MSTAMGIFDKVKDAAGKAKDLLDGQVDKHGDKLPGQVTDAYGKASAAAEKVIPGTGGEPSASERLIKDD